MAIAAGIVIGIFPKFSILPWLLGLACLFTRTNFFLTLTVAVLVSLPAIRADWIFHEVGNWFLATTQLQPLWLRLETTPFASWLGLNNTIVMGVAWLSPSIAFVSYHSSRRMLVRLSNGLTARRLRRLETATGEYREVIGEQVLRRKATELASPNEETPLRAAKPDKVNSTALDAEPTDKQPKEKRSEAPKTKLAPADRFESILHARLPVLNPDEQSDLDNLIEVFDGKAIIDPATGEIERIESHSGPTHHAAFHSAKKPQSAMRLFDEVDTGESEEEMLQSIAEDILHIARDSERVRQLIRDEPQSSEGYEASKEQMEAPDTGQRDDQMLPIDHSRQSPTREDTNDSHGLNPDSLLEIAKRIRANETGAESVISPVLTELMIEVVRFRDEQAEPIDLPKNNSPSFQRTDQSPPKPKMKVVSQLRETSSSTKAIHPAGGYPSSDDSLGFNRAETSEHRESHPQVPPPASFGRVVPQESLRHLLRHLSGEESQP